jgi:hypothetical protein
MPVWESSDETGLVIRPHLAVPHGPCLASSTFLEAPVMGGSGSDGSHTWVASTMGQSLLKTLLWIETNIATSSPVYDTYSNSSCLDLYLQALLRQSLVVIASWPLALLSMSLPSPLVA